MGLWLYCVIRNFCGIAACKGITSKRHSGAGKIGYVLLLRGVVGHTIRVLGIVAFTLYHAGVSKRLKVMAFATKNMQIMRFITGINQTVCMINVAAVTFNMFKWLRFTYSCHKPITLDIFYQFVNLFKHLFVFGKPFKIFIKSLWGKNKIIHLPWPLVQP